MLLSHSNRLRHCHFFYVSSSTPSVYLTLVVSVPLLFPFFSETPFTYFFLSLTFNTLIAVSLSAVLFASSHFIFQYHPTISFSPSINHSPTVIVTHAHSDAHPYVLTRVRTYLWVWSIRCRTESATPQTWGNESQFPSQAHHRLQSSVMKLQE